MINKIKNIDPSTIFLLLLVPFFFIYSEIKKNKTTKHVVRSDALFYHEYIAVHLFGMAPYFPREKVPVIKVTMGMAITYLPATAVGYIVTEINGIGHGFGKNDLYQRILYYSGFLYAFIGLIFLRLILKRWFDNWVIAIVLAILFFGTNLYYYIRAEPLMPHITGFAFITGFIYYCLKLFDKATLKTSIGIGICLALLILIRPYNMVIIIFVIIYFLSQKSLWRDKLKFITNHITIWLVIIGCVIIAFIPQMIYWHHYTGTWLYYTYGKESFFWDRPALLQVLFSFRKGWFIYTPLMIFIIPGFFICYKKNKPLFGASIVFFLLNLYIISSWWCWWYGGSFGMRPLIDTYGLMAILIGFFLQYLWEKTKPVFIGMISILGFFVYLNLYQTRQARTCRIHFDSMTYKAYCHLFLRERPRCTVEEWEAMLDAPNYEKAVNGERFW